VARILVAEEIAPSGIELMLAAGHEVDVATGLAPDELAGRLPGVHALVIRSATKVTAELLQHAPDLVVVGRAGIGLDNVDVKAATARGVLVVNAPQSNILSAAEHTMALLLAQARHVPQAHASLIAGRWERSRWEGVELHGKTLGIVGLGRIGALVAQRAAAFGMRLYAFDPYVTGDRARHMGVELTSLEMLVAESDFVTIHLPKSPETAGLFGRELLSKCKPGIRIVNAARGGIVDEEALAEAISSGHVAGAALDVFAEEPCTSSPLFELEEVVVTPHLGASTQEAQDKAGQTIAEMMVLALKGDFVPSAVNISAGPASETVRPFLALAETLGQVLAALHGGLPDRLEVDYEGALSSEDTRILTLAALKGIFSAGTEEPVSYVNAPQLAEERGLSVRESQTATPREYVSLVTVRSGAHSVGGTLAGVQFSQRIVMVDDHAVEVPPAPCMLVVRNDDRPGMIGAVGTALGSSGISISNMAVGQTISSSAEADGEPGTALMILSVERPAPPEVLEALRATPGILEVYAASLPA
jgi:D-3-phosphoglycerate dehydrogenase